MFVMSFVSNVFAASLIDDTATQAQQEVLEPVVTRYVYLVDRKTGTQEEYKIQAENQYAGLVSDFTKGKLVITSDDQAALMMLDKLDSLNQLRTTRKVNSINVASDESNSSVSKKNNLNPYSSAIFSITGL